MIPCRGLYAECALHDHCHVLCNYYDSGGNSTFCTPEATRGRSKPTACPYYEGGLSGLSCSDSYKVFLEYISVEPGY